jgi:hypothetical protein
LCSLLPQLAPGGRIVIGDIAFPDAAAAALEKVKIAAGEEWDDEFYWIADKAVVALQKINLKVEYVQVSSCVGIFTLQA